MIEVWQYRRWIWDSALSDLRNRYAGSAMGVFWNVANPLLTLAVYVFVFTGILVPRLGDRVPASVLFPLYLSAGFLPWIAFADGVVRSTQSLLTNAVNLKKVAIPEIVFVAQSSVSAGLSMSIAVILVAGLALVFGQPVSWTWILLPFVVLIWQVFGFGLGLALSAINVFFHDVSQILVVLLQVWMWSVPIVYFEEMLPQAYRAVLPFNPAYPFVTALRGALLDTAPGPLVWVSMLGWALVATLIGLWVASRLRSEIRDAL